MKAAPVHSPDACLRSNRSAGVVRAQGAWRTRARGFTLVEVLVALAVFALVAAAAVAILGWAADQQAGVRARMDRLAEVQRAHALLKADFSQVALRRTRLADGRPGRDAFNAAPPGRREGVLFAFVRRGWENPDAEPRASLQYVEYRLVDMRLERHVRDAVDGASTRPPQILLTGVAEVEPAYYAYRQWSDGWTGGAEVLPEAIRLDLQLQDYGAMRQVFLLPGTGS